VHIWDVDLAGTLGWNGLDRRDIIELEIEAWDRDYLDDQIDRMYKAVCIYAWLEIKVIVLDPKTIESSP
jgi:hypothetical protein